MATEQRPRAVDKKKRTYPGGGKLEPDDESGLDGEVPWNVVDDKTESEALDKVEETKDGPVSQPLDVIFVAGSLDGAHREEGREGPSDEVGNGESEGVDEDHGEESQRGDDDTVVLGHASLFLQLVEDRVPTKLE